MLDIVLLTAYCKDLAARRVVERGTSIGRSVRRRRELGLAGIRANIAVAALYYVQSLMYRRERWRQTYHKACVGAQVYPACLKVPDAAAGREKLAAGGVGEGCAVCGGEGEEEEG
jgi:hypothetical protein